MFYLLEPDIEIKGERFPWATDDRLRIFLAGCGSTRDKFYSVSTRIVTYLEEGAIQSEYEYPA